MERILIIHPHLSIIGGSEILTSILINELVSRDYHIAVVSKSIDANLDNVINIKKVRLWPLDNSNYKYGNLKEILSNILATLYEAIKSFSPDSILIMIHEPVYASLSKIIDPDTPVGIYIHYPKEEEVNSSNLDQFIRMYRFPLFDPKLYMVPDVHMVNSAYTASTLYRLYGIESNIVYPCIDWNYIREEPDLDRVREPIIISVGRIVPYKNFENIIKVFRSAIASRVNNARLIIAGSPDPRFDWYLERLKTAAESDDRIDLVIAPSKRRLIDLYQESLIYLHARIGEHFGIAPMEAISQGAIGIVPARSGLTEVLEPGAELFTYDSFKDIDNVVLSILSLDHRKIKKIRSRARFKTLFYNPERFSKEVLNYLAIPLNTNIKRLR